MKLIVEPDDGLAPLVAAIRRARTSIDMMIFRFDRPELEKALESAVTRGVAVRTLIAHTNSDGAQALRRLELRLLAAGVTVTRSADDLVRYHAKYFIVDRSRLFVLGFNYTALDIQRSRSFGLEVRSRKLVQEVLRLFEADILRQPWTPALSDVVVSPLNARERLGAFIRQARKQLLIYDPKLSDPGMLGLLRDRVRCGIDVRVIGQVAKGGSGIRWTTLNGRRLHVRAMMRDGARAFIGSQSLKRLELDARRELGLIVRDRQTVQRLAKVFEADWEQSWNQKGETTARGQRAEATVVEKAG